MKNIKFVIVSILFTAALFIGCQNPSSSVEDDNSGNHGNTPSESTSYTLTFDANYPFDTAEFKEKGNIYFYEGSFSKQEKTSGSKITLEVSPYCYRKCVYLNEAKDIYRTVDDYLFDHYNTNADDSGKTYHSGDVITLTKDITLYCFYTKKISNELDFTNISAYSMKIGERVTIADYFGDVYHVYTQIPDDSDVLEYLGNNIYEAKNVGSVIVRAKVWTEPSKTWWCLFTVTANEGYNGNSIEHKLIGTWVYKDSSSSGTIVLNADKTGHITAYLGSTAMHDTSFNWSAKEEKSGSTKKHYLKIENASGNLDGYHTLEDVRSNRFTLNEYLAFGMPQYTVWYRQ